MPKKESAKNRWKMIFKVEIGAKKYIFKVKIGAENWRNYWKIRFIKSKLGQKWKEVGSFFFNCPKKNSFLVGMLGKRKNGQKCLEKKKCPKKWFLSWIWGKMAKNGREIKKIAKIGAKKFKKKFLS